MARKAKAKLPFLVEPKRQPIMEKLGNEETGVIELPRRGYLTVAEKAFVQQGVTGDTSVLQVQRLASKVARKSGCQVQEVMDAMSQGDFSNPGFDGLEDELDAALSGLSSMDARQKMIAVTGLILFRASDEWTVDDTVALHPDLVDEVYLLYLEEDKRSLEAFEALELRSNNDEQVGAGK